jgi:hypothetical protein
MRSGLRLSSRVVVDGTGGARDDTHRGLWVEKEELGESETACPCFLQTGARGEPNLQS